MEVEKSSGRGKSRGRGRGRKKAVENENKPPETLSFPQERSDPEPVTLDMDADITQLEAPTFSTINKGPPEPMLRLNWDHKTHLIGEKVINPMIHCCDKCESPILIYGRMIPCKHVFCLSCAEREGKVCPRCQEKIVRIEKTGLGTVFMCTFGGSRYGNTGCRRTYLSQRDLQAHINHRHVTGSQNKEHITASGVIPSAKTSLSSSNRLKTVAPLHAVANDPRVQNNSTSDYFHKIHTQSGHSTLSSPHQTSRQQQSQHQHSSLSHSQDTQQSHQHTMHSHPNSLSSSQLHLSVSGSQQLLQSDFNSPLLVPNYPPPSTHSGTVNSSSSLRGNLITVPINDSNVDSVNSIGIPLPPGFSHQSFSPQFSQSSSGIPFPVPPPGQLPNMGQLSQSHPQFFPSSPANYTTSAQQRTPAFSPSQQTQTIMNQSIITSRAPPMVPPPRISQFPNEPTIQSFNVPPPHRWHPPPNQTHFY